MWKRMLECNGFPAFATEASRQLIRWEEPYGWTRRCAGRVSEKETSLSTVLAAMLTVPDTWVTFANCYLTALEEVATPRAGSRASQRSSGRGRSRRAEALADWHATLLDRFAGTEDEGILDRLATSPGLEIGRAHV